MQNGGCLRVLPHEEGILCGLIGACVRGVCVCGCVWLGTERRVSARLPHEDGCCVEPDCVLRATRGKASKDRLMTEESEICRAC